MTNIRRDKDLMNFTDSLFDSFFSNNISPRQFNVDIIEKDGGYMLKADLPGFEKGDINITYSDNILSIGAESKKESEEKSENGRYLRRERSTASIKRQFIVKDLDREAIKASFENGVLNLDLPLKKEEEAESTRIEIE
ncbi:MAG: Hsp20/alpha crystallin family protein [Bacillota bacterium]|nr:Hsp20/alpha crystallin family protein [Bacillota bacterium]